MNLALRAGAVFLGFHVAALGLGLFGLLSAVPNAAQFAGNPWAMAFYDWAIVNTGTVDILTATAAMLAYGIGAIGLRRTLCFFAIATTISACAELTGTKTGWPFGGYEYTGFLGLKLAGRVPYTVPLSWFYMGFASYLIARRVAGTAAGATTAAILLGAWLLTAWDLVLDPAMASAKMSAMHFWIWKEHGAYFGMPLRNLAGWFGTGLAFIALGRASFGDDAGARAPAFWIPLGIYGANLTWAMALGLAAGLWPCALIAIALGAVPAALALRKPRRIAPMPAA